jgi:nitroreductase
MKEIMMKAFNFRHACKQFDESRKVAKEDIDFILEAGRLSPSSFGVEHWRFIVVESADLKKQL